MKKIIITLFISLSSIALLFSSCNDSDQNFTNGAVKYISLEGGFYGIVSDDQKNYDPINLPKEFQIDGKRIMFKYKVRSDLASFHMWGIIIELTEVQELK